VSKSRLSVTRRICLVAAVCLGVIPILRSSADEISESWPDANKANVKFGDADYPQLNPRPTKILRLSGELPSSLRVNFLLRFEASENAGGPIQSSRYCGYVQNSPVSPAYSLTESLHVVRDEHTYTASIQADKYLPGRCGWHLFSIGYRVVDGGENFSDGPFAAVFDPAVSQGREQELYRGEVNTWCTRKPFTADPGQHERCAVFPILKEFAPVPPETLASIPLAKRTKQHLTWVFPDTPLIVMNFYDLDVDRGAPPSGSSTPPTAR
jgi:hypothetical protein